MLTALDVDPAKLDQHEQKFVAQIREHGAEFAKAQLDLTDGNWSGLREH